MSETDLELLTRYVRRRSEDAFSEIVRRHVDMAYSAALRQVRSSAVAEEVAQTAFVELARQAHRLPPQTIVPAWLYQVTRRRAIDVVRRESKRQLREQVAQEIHSMNADPTWTEIEPLLDEAMHSLGETDRAAVVLRFFENKSLREVGQALGASEKAAQKRLSRALERLRAFLTRRGVTISASGLSVVISAHAVKAAPIGIAVQIANAAALATVGAPMPGLASATAKAIAMTSLQKTVVVSLLAVMTGAGLYQVHHASRLRKQLHAVQQQEAALRRQIQSLERERDTALRRLGSVSAKTAPRLPTPPIKSAAVSPEDPIGPNVYERIKGQQPKLSLNQLEAYLQANGRNAASLLAAYRTSGEAALLDEAIQNFPKDAQVSFEAAFRSDISPEQRGEWLKSLKEADPKNALADYLSAAHHFKLGQADQAVQDLIAASSKSDFHDYTLERVQDDEEAYRAAGYSVAEAKTIPSMQLLLPQLAEMKNLSQSLTDLANSYRQAGDESSAQAALLMATALGQRYSNPAPGEPEISQLVGIAIERSALKQMDPATLIGNTELIASQRLDQLAKEREALQRLAKQSEALMPKVSDQDLISYKDRWRNFGEAAAGRWLLQKYGVTQSD